MRPASLVGVLSVSWSSLRAGGGAGKLSGDPMSIPVLTWVAEPRGDGGEDTWLCSGTSVNYWKCELSALQTTFQRRDTI